MSRLRIELAMCFLIALVIAFATVSANIRSLYWSGQSLYYLWNVLILRRLDDNITENFEKVSTNFKLIIVYILILLSSVPPRHVNFIHLYKCIDAG